MSIRRLVYICWLSFNKVVILALIVDMRTVQFIRNFQWIHPVVVYEKLDPL